MKNTLPLTEHQQHLNDEKVQEYRKTSGMDQLWLIAGANKGRGEERVFDHKFVGTATQTLQLQDLLHGIARDPDCIPFLVQQLNAR
jgi:hypothetical protein